MPPSLLPSLESVYKRRDSWRNEDKPIGVLFADGDDEPCGAGCGCELVS